jgi:hypothetical protein
MHEELREFSGGRFEAGPGDVRVLNDHTPLSTYPKDLERAFSSLFD